MIAKHSLKKSTFQRTYAKTHGTDKGAFGMTRWSILPQEAMEYAASFKSRKIILRSSVVPPLLPKQFVTEGEWAMPLLELKLRWIFLLYGRFQPSFNIVIAQC